MNKGNESRPPLADDGPYYTREEVADHFRVAPQTVHDWVTRGEMDCVYAGKHMRFTRAHVKEYERTQSAAARRARRAATEPQRPADNAPRPVQRRRAVG